MLELGLLFLRLGVVSFGGPAAHIALMRHEFVERRRWLTDAAFLDLIGATNLIPGPNSTEVAIHIGRMRGGWPGLIVAGVCFILPAATIVGVLAAVYVRAGSLPVTESVLRGIKPVVIAIVVIALWQLARTAIRNTWHVAAAAAVVAAIVTGAHELLVLAVCGSTGAAIAATGSGKRMKAGGLLLAATAPMRAGASVSAGAVAVASAAIVPVSLSTLFMVFLKAGAFLFGSGYVLLAFLRADFVDRLGWLTEQQLLDAIAVGQVTPGPVFTTATFIGYLLAGPSGSILATVAIFLPAFVFVALSAPLIPRLRQSKIAGGALDGVNLASLALMATVTWQLGRGAVTDLASLAVAVLSFAALVRWRVNATWLILGGALVGLLR